MTVVAVLVPCRNEEDVLARKLRNLRVCRWPRARAQHRVFVIDDGSEDRTAQVAQRERFERDDVRVEILANDVRPGKSGAIETGLRALSSEVDVVVLTDADVVVEPGALEAIVATLERDARVGMVSGAQTFVDSLSESGELRASDGGPLRSEGSFYDHAAAWIRSLESRWGLVYSVQGQWMAWRAGLGLRPTPGFAADDLDLMLQARVAGCRTVRAPAARFFEVRAPRGEARRSQQVRRARAYLQFLRHPRIQELRSAGSWLARRQAALYLQAGRARGPWSLFALGSTFLAGWYLGPHAAIAVAAANAIVFLPVWVLLRIVRSRMELAEALEARSALGERWETARR
jgi:GT2 family glycosyltransferase